MSINIETKVILKGGRYYGHIKCNGSETKVVYCPKTIVNPILKNSYNNAQTTKVSACAMQKKLKGKGGSTSKDGTSIMIYKTFLSYNKAEISALIARIGVSKASFHISRTVGARLKAVLTSELSELVSAIEAAIEVIDVVTDTLEEIAATEEVSTNEAIYQIIENTRECLDISTNLRIIFDYSNNDGYKILLNDNTEYHEYMRYGLYNGDYQIKNIPFNQPIAILNQGLNNNGESISNYITYTGDEKTRRYKQVEIGSHSSTWKTYEFYTGTINITVNGNFLYYGNNFIDGGISLYHYELGYMGMENALIYTSDCAYVTGSTVGEASANCVDTSSIIVTTGIESGYPYYLFNDISMEYLFNVGAYYFKDISENTPMNIIINNDLSDSLIFTGNDLSYISVDNSVNYYYGETFLTISGSFNDTDMVLVYWDNENDISYVQNTMKYETSCSIDLIDSIENISAQLALELFNFELNLDDVSTGADNLINSKLIILSKLLYIVSQLITLVIKYYLINGIVDISGDISGSDINLFTVSTTIKASIQEAILSFEAADTTDITEVMTVIDDVSTIIDGASTDIVTIINSQKDIVSAAAASITDLDFELDLFTPYTSLESTDPTYIQTQYFNDSLLIEFIATSGTITANTWDPNFVVDADISLTYNNRDLPTSSITGDLHSNITSYDNGYINLPPSSDISFNLTSSPGYMNNVSYELWVDVSNTNENVIILEDLSRNITIKEDEIDTINDTWIHIVKTFSQTDSTAVLYYNGKKQSTDNTSLKNTSSDDSKLIIQNTSDADYYLAKFNIYNRVLTASDISFLSQQPRLTDSFNMSFVQLSNKKYYKFKHCAYNTYLKLEIEPYSLDTDGEDLLGSSLWDNTDSWTEDFPSSGNDTLISTTTSGNPFKIEIIIIKYGVFTKFPNSLTASDLLANYSDNIVEFSNYKSNITTYIDQIYLNNLNTDAVFKPTITLSNDLDYVITMLNNFGITNSIQDTYVAMYSLYE